jgi:hypothetical protein
VSGFVAVSHAGSAQIGVRPHITRDEAIAIVGSADLGHEIDALSPVNSMRHSVAIPHRRRNIMDNGDANADDDANEVDESLNILDVAMSSGGNEPYYSTPISTFATTLE